METIASTQMLKSVINGLSAQSTGSAGQKIMVYAADGTPAGKMQAPTKNMDDVYSKTEVNGLVDTPHQEYVTVDAYASLPVSGSTDTIYRVSGWDGSANNGAGAADDTVYSEYAWNGTQYIFLCVKSQIGEVFDITVYNSNTKYADLADALGTNGANVPQNLRKSGMSVKFVQSSDNRYVQYRYMGTAITGNPNPFLNITNWQGVDAEPTDGSDNLVKSGGVKKNILEEQNNIFATLEGKGLFVPLKTNYYNNLSILNDNTWYRNTITGNGYIAPIPVGLSKLRVTANDDKNSLIALLKSDAHESGTRADYAEGWTFNDGVIQKGTTVEISLPNDCNYIYIKASASSSSATDDVMPSSIEMVASIREDVNALENNFSTLAGTVALQGNDINDLKNTTVKITTQSFTNAQKGQARINIGAIDITEAKTLVEDTIADFSEKVEGPNYFKTGNVGLYYRDGSYRGYVVYNYVFLDVEEGDVIRLYNWQTSRGLTSYIQRTQMTVAAYNSFEQVVAASGQDENTSSSYTVPSGIVRICVSVNISQVTKPCVTVNLDNPPSVETPYVEPKNVVITDSTLTNEELPANSKAVGNALALKMNISDFAIRPKDIKQTPFLEDFRFCEILPNKVVLSVTTIEGKNYIVWNNSAQNWYTIAINIRSYKDLVLVSDILPQSVISRFLTIGIDTGETNIEFVAWANSNESFSYSPNAYVFDDEKMTITLLELYKTYGYKGNIVLYIKMPASYKINWLASGMQLESYDWMKIGSHAKSALKDELKADNVKIVIPDVVYAVVNHEMNIYYESIILCDDIDRYGIDYHFNQLTEHIKVQNERIRIYPTSAFPNGVQCSIGVTDKVTNKLIASKSFVVKVLSAAEYDKKIIFLGDSLTDRCIYPAEICQELGNNRLVSIGTLSDSLSYVGSEGTVTVTNFANEGRGGWSALSYLVSQEAKGKTNAFWNPDANGGEGGFDFAYYMTHNNYDAVDCVVIALGPNDIASITINASVTVDTVVGNFRQIVENIHDYDSNIKIIITLTPKGSERDGGGGDNYNYIQTYLVEALINEFSNDTNIWLAPVYLNIDYHNDYPTSEVAISARNPKVIARQNNNVHFSVDSTNPVSQCWGYLKMADVIWYTMMSAFAN